MGSGQHGAPVVGDDAVEAVSEVGNPTVLATWAVIAAVAAWLEAALLRE